MSENTKNSNDIETKQSWSDLKKTIYGVIGTVVTAGGIYLTNVLTEPKEPETTQPQQQIQTPIININNVQQNNVKTDTTPKTIIIKEVGPKKESVKKDELKKGSDEYTNENSKW